MAERKRTLVLGIAIKIHVNTPDATTKGINRNSTRRIGSIACNTGDAEAAELRKIEIPELKIIMIGTNNNTTM